MPGPSANDDEWRLVRAVQSDEPLDVIQRMVRAHPSLVRKKDENGRLPLHYAARYSKVDVVKFIAGRWWQALRERTDMGSLPLHLAAQFSTDLTVVAFLVNKSPKALQERNLAGSLPLHVAAANAPPDVLQFLVDKAPEALREKDKEGQVPLHVAARRQHATLGALQPLLDTWAPALQQSDRHGKLPLHVAAQFSSAEVVLAFSSRYPRALKVKDGAGWVPLHYASARRADDAASLPVVECLLRAWAPALAVKKNDGWLPLHVAARNGASPLVVERLASALPQALHEPIREGWLPLHLAVASGAPAQVVQPLMDKWVAALGVMDAMGALPLHLAARHSSVGVVQRLANAFPPALKATDRDGWLPLHYAACYAPLEVAQCLADLDRAALNVHSTQGERPVNIAWRKRKLDVMKWLLLAEVDADPAASKVEPAPHESASVRDEKSENSQAARVTVDDPAVSTVAERAVHPPGTCPSDPHRLDRDRIRKVIDQSSREPALVSSAYVDSIRTQSLLGDGFFGTVTLGKDQVLGRDFAIKSIHTEILRGGSKQELEDAMKTFRTEQKALSHFRHPNIAALFAYTDPFLEEKGGGYHLVYELAEKGSLDSFLKDDLGRSRLGSFPRRVQIAIDVLTAIRFLHEGSEDIESCFHRDVKSANIVLKRDFTAQLIDCGLAKFVNDQVKTTGIKGTRGYICPEYVKTGKYLAACDIYSFGVVLLELWTGRLQNHEDETGKTFNFGEEYAYEGRDVKQDMDVAMDLADPLPKYASRFAKLGLKCIRDRCRRRPSGDELLKDLHGVLQKCSKSCSGADITLFDTSRAATEASDGTETCSTCRTMPSVPTYNVCALCLFRKEIREAFSSVVSISQTPLASAIEGVSKQIGGLSKAMDPVRLEGLSKQIEEVSQKVDAALPVLAHLDRRLANPVPRMFLLIPSDLRDGWKHPRSWLRSKVQKKFYLFFVCAVSHVAVSPPIKLTAPKEWVRTVAPVLAAGLYLLQISLKAGLNVSLDLADGAATGLLSLSLSHVAEMCRELSLILDETGHVGLLDRLRSRQLTDADVQELSGDAYELVIEKACEQRGWRSHMEPVRVPPSPQVMWVTKAVATDPAYEIVTS